MSSQPEAPFASIEEAIDEIRAGRIIVVADDADRENEGDLTCAAVATTPEIINFMARFGRGLVCTPMAGERLDALRIPMMTEDNTSTFGTAFCESVDARDGVTTGISAADRARSIQVLVDPKTRPEDLVRPGHTFPLRARKGGVLERAGQTEASVDLARMAGLAPAGVICEIMNDDGTMARIPELIELCKAHNLKIITVADLIRYRLLHERYVLRWAESELNTVYGPARMIAYRDELDHEFHSALVIGNPDFGAPVLVRVQSHCLPGLAFGSTDCNCAHAREAALELIRRHGSGIFVYLHQTTAGYLIADEGGHRSIAHGHTATPEHDHERVIQRQTGVGAQILSDLGVRQIRLLTDHPRRVAALEGYGLRIVEQLPLTHTQYAEQGPVR